METRNIFYRDRHNLRDERVDAVGDQVIDEIKRVGDLLAALDSRECTGVDFDDIPVRVNASPSRKKQVAPTKSNCVDDIRKMLDDKKIDFDDYKYWIRFPVPVNAIPDTAIQILDGRLNPDGTRTYDAPELARRNLYQMVLFKQWVERISDQRCRLFFECMKQTEREQKMKLIKLSFVMKNYIDEKFSEAAFEELEAAPADGGR